MGTIKYLGINIYHSEGDSVEGNIYKAVSSIRRSLDFWIGLPLSPMGRVAVAKMLILPRLLYIFTALPFMPPRTFFKDLGHCCQI